MKKTNMIPLEDRVLIYPDPAPEKLGSLQLPDQHKKAHQPPKGTVVAVGPGKLITGNGILFKIYMLICEFMKRDSDIQTLMPLKPGDRVMYGAYANMEVEDPETKEKFLCLRLDDCFIKLD